MKPKIYWMPRRTTGLICPLEIESFTPLKRKLAAADNSALIAGVTQHYREILLQRWQTYRKSAVSGIAPYARHGRPEISPAKELRAATASSKFLARYYPDLYNVWLNSELPAGAEEQFYWLNRKVEDRPTGILGHRVLQISDAGSVILSRQFFVAHSYNSSQLTAGCLPYRNGAIVFYTHRTSTDQVAGMGSSLKHSIGREQMKEQMVRNLERVRSEPILLRRIIRTRLIMRRQWLSGAEDGPALFNICRGRWLSEKGEQHGTLRFKDATRHDMPCGASV